MPNPPADASTNYSTQDYGLANWLVFNGIELLGTVEFPGDTRKSFVFVTRYDVNRLVEEWQSPDTDEAAICKAFFKAHTIVKKNLKESLNVADVGPRPHN